MRKYSLSITALIIAMCSSAPFAQPVPAKQPKLMLLVVIDQFRYDYLLRFRDQYTGGLSQLLNRGAVFDNAQFEHYPTVTAIGHATTLTGASVSSMLRVKPQQRADHSMKLHSTPAPNSIKPATKSTA